MYGLVNQSIEGLIVKEYGEEKWQTIKNNVGFEDEIFIGMQSYDDDITFRLVGAACKELDVDPIKLLESFGEYWILYTAQEGYGELMEMVGTTFVEFLSNLDNLHRRLGDIMPLLNPPSFTIKKVEEGLIELQYKSKREGLNAMVVGLLKGLGNRFDLQGIDIVQGQTGKEADYFITTFSVSWIV